MRRKYIGWLLLIVFLWTSVLTGCTTVPTVAVPPPVASVDQPLDLSDYFVTKEPAEENVVPIEPDLSYVDTDYLMRLMKIKGDISQTRTAYEQYPDDWTFVLIDSRPPARYNEAHINGAINIPDAQFEDNIHLLPEDKNKMLIFYCGGWHCPLSPSSAKKAQELGYTNVHVYQEGTEAWEERLNYYVTTPSYVADLITADKKNDVNSKPLLLIDARPYSAYFGSHIPGSMAMDDTIFIEKYLDSMPQDKTTEIITYCGGFFCGKSHKIAHFLVNRGYENVKVLAGGLPAWKSAGLPLFGAEAGGVAFDITGGKPDRKITGAIFTEQVTAGLVTVIDVRNDQERASGAIKGSIHIPDSQIHADPKAIASKLPADKNTVLLIHCASGARASGVVEKIAELGYPNTFYLDGRIVINGDGTFSTN